MRMLKINITVIAVLLLMVFTMWKSFQLERLALSPPSHPETVSQGPKKNKEDKQIVWNFDYFLVQGGTPQVHLQGDEGVVPSDPNESLDVSVPRGEIYQVNSDNFHYQALKGQLFSHEQKVYLQEQVLLKNPTSQLTGEKADYHFETKIFNIADNVHGVHRDEVKKQTLKIDAAQGQGLLGQDTYIFRHNVSGVIERDRKFEAPVFFRAQLVEAKMPENIIYLTDAVWIKQNRLEGEGLRGEIFLENYNKKLKYYGLYDDVRLKQNPLPGTLNGKIRYAQGERLDGFFQEKKIVLTGNPRLLQGGNAIRGTEITFFEDTDVVEAINSNSNIDLHPRSKSEQ